MHWIHAKFAHDTSLCMLVIFDNKIRDNCIAVICSVFKTNRSITHLDISHNQFGLTAVVNVCNTILIDSSACGLKTMVIESNKLFDAGASLIATALKTNTRLCTLNVENDSIGPLGIKSLADMLLQNTTLEMLPSRKIAAIAPRNNICIAH